MTVSTTTALPPSIHASMSCKGHVKESIKYAESQAAELGKRNLKSPRMQFNRAIQTYEEEFRQKQSTSDGALGPGLIGRPG